MRLSETSTTKNYRDVLLKTLICVKDFRTNPLASIMSFVVTPNMPMFILLIEPSTNTLA